MSACCVLHKFSRLSASLFLYLTGALALRTLLTGAKSIYSPSRRRRCFEKEGTLFTALKDFEEVNPKNVKEYTNPRGVSIFDCLMILIIIPGIATHSWISTIHVWRYFPNIVSGHTMSINIHKYFIVKSIRPRFMANIS